MHPSPAISLLPPRRPEPGENTFDSIPQSITPPPPVRQARVWEKSPGGIMQSRRRIPEYFPGRSIRGGGKKSAEIKCGAGLAPPPPGPGGCFRNQCETPAARRHIQRPRGSCNYRVGNRVAGDADETPDVDAQLFGLGAGLGWPGRAYPLEVMLRNTKG